MAEAALNKLDQFVVEKTGSKLGFLYQDLVEECLSALRQQLEQAKPTSEQQKSEASYVPFPQSAPEPAVQQRVAQRQEKEKTRPAQPSLYEITPLTRVADTQNDVILPQTFQVSQTTADVFTTLFAKTHRGLVSWSNFTAAMAELGFSVIPKFGSVYTFLLPNSMAVKKSLTIHRPHGSNIQGYLTLVFASRLKRVYGWSEKTFEIV